MQFFEDWVFQQATEDFFAMLVYQGRNLLHRRLRALSQSSWSPERGTFRVANPGSAHSPPNLL